MSFRIAVLCLTWATAFSLPGSDGFELRVTQTATTISHWEAVAYWQLAATILIAALGATVTAIQAARASGARG